jgi:UDPglucose--hexose-1-phosphate uridylyltransferase
VLVSPHRTQRPWQGQTEKVTQSATHPYDPSCYLCPGNARANGEHTPQYESTYVFENDFAALLPEGEIGAIDAKDEGLLRAIAERGVCRVLCFDPRHDLTLATMDRAQVRRVVDTWAAQAAELGARDYIRYVQIFENRGEMMGASNPHPHGQIWATEHIPNEPLAELNSQRAYFAEHAEPLLAAYLRMEMDARERVVLENECWVALVPFWAVWPFETMLLPQRAIQGFADFTDKEREGLTAILQTLTAGYNRVFDVPFPYSMGFHPAPCDGEDHAEWVLHAHFFPPLLRSATVRKFMVGFELLGSPQRDITAEIAAAMLRKAMPL